MKPHNYLARQIVNGIKKDFEIYHLSMNLVDTITIEKYDNKAVIHIPAKTYDMYKYVKDNVIVYNNRGSYASRLNEEGSYIFNKHIGHHIGYIDKAIDDGIVKLVQKVQKEHNTIRVEKR